MRITSKLPALHVLPNVDDDVCLVQWTSWSPSLAAPHILTGRPVEAFADASPATCRVEERTLPTVTPIQLATVSQTAAL
jgi:hypothetical protein